MDTFLVGFFVVVGIVVAVVVGALVWYVKWRCRKTGGVGKSMKEIFLPDAPAKAASDEPKKDEKPASDDSEECGDVWPHDAEYLKDWKWYSSPESKAEVEAAKSEMPLLIQKMQLLETQRMREATENQYRDQVFNRPNEKPSIIDAVGSIATTMSEHYGVEEFKLAKKELQDKIDACQEKIDRYAGLAALFGDDCEFVREHTLGPRLRAHINDEIKQRMASRGK